MEKKILVGTVLSTIPKMVIFRALSGTRYSFKEIQCPYEKFFTTEIHPNGNTILTATAASKQISFWVEDKISFEWKVAVEISCLYGINNMCFNQDGDKIAILAGKHLRLFYYDNDSSDGGPFQSRLEKMDLEDDDGKDRFSTCSLKRHCDSSISVNWSRTDELLTGSSLGTMCIHMQCLYGTGSYVVKYFRYKDLHSCNISGLVTCVAWNPLEPTMLASAGVDGFVILWKLLDPSVALTYIRSYALEARYFLPQRPRYLSMNEDAIRDVASVSSVDTTMSSTFNSDSDLDSDSSNDGQGGVKGNPVEAALQEISLRQKKVAKSLKVLVETLKKVKERAGGPKDLINQILKSVDQISSDQADIRDLMNSHKDNIEKAISDIQDQVSDVEQTFKEELQDLKGKMAVENTNLSSDVLAAIRQVKQSNDALEGKILSRQTQFEDSLLERHRKMEESALLRLGQFEEMVLTKMKSQEDTIVQKQDASERSVMTRLTQLDKTTVSVTSSLESSFQLKHNQLLETTEPRYKLMEEKLDQLNGLCEKMFKLLSK